MQSSSPNHNRKNRGVSKVYYTAALCMVFFALIQIHNFLALYEAGSDVLDTSKEYFASVNQTSATNIRFRYIFTIGVWSDEAMKSHWPRARKTMLGALETQFYSRKLESYHETLTMTTNLPFQECNSTYNETYLDELITHFRSFDDEIKKRYLSLDIKHSSEEIIVNIPTNLIPITPFDFTIDCPAEKYYGMDIIYKACNDTNVECGHIVWLRDPYEIVQSNDWQGKMSDFSNLFPGVSTALSILGSRMLMYPDQLVACFEYEDATLEMDLWNQQNTRIEWRKTKKHGIFKRTSKYLKELGIERRPPPRDRLLKRLNTQEKLWFGDLISVSDFVRSLCVRQ